MRHSVKLVLLVGCISLSFACSPASPKLKPATVPIYEKVDFLSNSLDYTPVVDILFVIDDSGSMSSSQSNLAQNINYFLNEFTKQKNIDYHIGVITTDMNKADRRGQLIGKTKIITAKTPNLIQELRDNIIAGISGSTVEKTFEPIQAALTEPLVSTTNAGFLRTNAYLAIIYLGDEDDQSNIAAQALFTQLVGIKSSLAKVLTYGVMQTFAGQPAPCGSMTPQPRLESFFKMSVNSAANLLSLCDTNFGLKLAGFSKDLVKYLNGTIYLDRAPIVDTIKVFFGQQEIFPHPVTGWYFNPKLNAIVLGSDVKLNTDQGEDIPLRIKFDSAQFKEEQK